MCRWPLIASVQSSFITRHADCFIISMLNPDSSIKVKWKANNRNLYNQVPHLDT